jgi:AAA15 family ATPase/GTPase
MPLYSWFARVFPVSSPVGGYPTFRSAGFMADTFWVTDDEGRGTATDEDARFSVIRRFRQLLKAADTGIVGMKPTETMRELRGRTLKRQTFLFQHQTDDEDSWLDLEEESAGTKALFRMAPSVFMALDLGGLLLVDELESSLHPLLGLMILRLFNSPETNPRNAQMLFTTHDTNLMGTTLGEPPLRRDQIWFTEKEENGGTRVYPLTDYKPRKSENLERGYLQGRYGAIPFLGPIDWMTE